MTKYLPKGVGFNVEADFGRAAADREITIAPDEYAKPGYVIGYIDGFPESNLGFLRAKRVRVHVQEQFLKDR